MEQCLYFFIRRRQEWGRLGKERTRLKPFEGALSGQHTQLEQDGAEQRNKAGAFLRPSTHLIYRPQLTAVVHQQSISGQRLAALISP